MQRAKVAHAVFLPMLRSTLTHEGSYHWVGFILVGLESAEEVSGGVQGAAPDDAQAWEVQRQQHKLAAQRVALQPHPCTSMYIVTFLLISSVQEDMRRLACLT